MMMRVLFGAILTACCLVSPMFANVVVFWQENFPTVGSQPITRAALEKALEGAHPMFVDLDGLRDPSALSGADLLVLPYGSAIPADAWPAIRAHTASGGNLLVLGGQPFRVPVTRTSNGWQQGLPQDTYARDYGFYHTYALEPIGNARFAWKTGYSFMHTPRVRARHYFAVEGLLLGHGKIVDIHGLGYMVNNDGTAVAAPVIVSDHSELARDRELLGSRLVMLDFDPEPGYWESPDGVSLIHESAEYARRGTTEFWIETLYSTIKTGEAADVTVHLRNVRRQRLSLPAGGEIKIELLSGETTLETAHVACPTNEVDAAVVFRKATRPDFYTLRATYTEGSRPLESYENGFWIEDEQLLRSGPLLGVKDDFLNRDGKPFFPVGTNYFTTEDQNWDFSGPRNALAWERDFAEMAKYGVSFVRTGVWEGYPRFVEPTTAGVNERFLRNLEAFLLSARRHNIVVNFTFFAFAPRVGEHPAEDGPVLNPYLDPVALEAEQKYIRSVVARFRNVPSLCWDLINEPSFSNPRRLWKGNTPNGDPAELGAWHAWLRQRYGSTDALAAAWSVTPQSVRSFDEVPLPSIPDLTFDRYGNSRHVRAFDYNLFAQDMFTEWVRGMVRAIREAGSNQLINVGQDEGGVADRVLNHFYASGGVSFTSNHSYWRDDSLLWDSVVAKRPGIPNILGETGYQPVWQPDGAWRYDELTGRSLLERKWVLGFAAGTSGIAQWDWAREVDFGMKRSDGSAKTWQPMMRSFGQFAEKAAPYATSLVQPQIAIVLPQSTQLSIFTNFGIESQQKAVRALYHYARGDAYAVGEYQLDLLGEPRLILLPSPLALDQHAWETLVGKVQAGATLLITGPFDYDPHFHATSRERQLGVEYHREPLMMRENELRLPDAASRLIYGSEKITYLDRAVLKDNASWVELTVGKGKVLFSPLPLEFNENLDAIGDVYRYAMKAAQIQPAYSTTTSDRAILIAPTRFPRATLYVLMSESDSKQEISFTDNKSGKTIAGTLEPGRAAALLVTDDGKIPATYNWNEAR